MDPNRLLVGLIVSSIGLGFFVYGKKQRAIVPLICGFCLMILPYFVADILWMMVIGGALAFLPYFFRV